VRSRPDYAGPALLGPGEVAIVGRVELVPPLQKSDQNIRAISPFYDFENTVYLLVDDKPRTFDKEPGMWDMQGHIATRFGETFFKRLPARAHYISLAMIFMQLGKYRPTEKVYLPGQLAIAVAPGDHAVYIGTIRYHRTPFFEVERIEVVDEWERARDEFVERFGDARRLRKGLAQVIAQPSRRGVALAPAHPW